MDQGTGKRGGSAATIELLEDRRLLSVSLVKDINVLPSTLAPEGLMSAGALVYFQHAHTEHGAELWRTDGTSAGTQLVKDIAPGPVMSAALPLGEIAGILYFRADDVVHGS